MKILLAASEAVPFCKTGGLADVVGALAKKLAGAGHDVHLFLPKYRAVDFAAFEGGASYPLSVRVGSENLEAFLRVARWNSVSVYFIDYPPYFERDGLYGAGGADYPDNDRRFILFSRAVLDGAKAAGLRPEVIHGHDWQTALICAYLKRAYARDSHFSRTGSLLTIHNMAYQGNFPSESLGLAGFGPEDFTADGFEFYGRFSFLKAGVACADLLSTVSPTYAREIQELPERGFGFEGLLKRRTADLSGVLNGVDMELWNPETDAALGRNYSSRDFTAGKARAKSALQALCGLDQRSDLPLIGIISRLDWQKGLDLALEVLRPRLGRAQVVALGAGDPKLAEALAALARQDPRSAYLRTEFDDKFARQVYAGADIFLMPSRFEPCGLGQMIAMRYGAIPVVTRTGGLADTVFESGTAETRMASAAPSAALAASGTAEMKTAAAANGFVCAPDDAADLARALDRALAAYRDSSSWRGRVGAAMGCDFSWDRSVEAYLGLYDRARKGS